ncbi:MAG: ribonuclease P protein component [Planctomycetaceae bacterium]|nr:ribonuclease P protein component [Planctomycetaceae bacterium]|tara:strand:- start:1493 stop:1849 length:357 start_codon:yes stop_codon:yes gene_type:complete
MSNSLTFPKSLRLRTPEEFSAVYASGVFAADKVLVINLKANRKNSSRMGLSIPKKTGNSPVRNQWKRYCREAFRTQQNKLPRGIDFIIRPRKGAIANAGSIRKSLVNLLERGKKKLEQ